ncbi:hypothetical protein KFZ76_11790 [Methylovulum psychrotolerans]|uniref:hypothetical protein n=1 Tax=Methylovulum psychrotolerans TaxID=1704499 RepID=UPI001BFF4464|nr:hypothetical protein [Methylovulum psychrotolerans]MBT9098388.1 hypothetical protein [Methylovulum psychrotolerans]
MNWVDIIKKTGSVGVVGYLFYYLMTEIFSEKIINLFGSERFFAIILILLSVLSLVFVLAIPNSKNKKQKTDKDNSTKNIHVVYKNKSTHKGDNNF